MTRSDRRLLLGLAVLCGLLLTPHCAQARGRNGVPHRALIHKTRPHRVRVNTGGGK